MGGEAIFVSTEMRLILIVVTCVGGCLFVEGAVYVYVDGWMGRGILEDPDREGGDRERKRLTSKVLFCPLFRSYTKAGDLDGYPYWGQLALYAGGGYVVPLKGSKTDLIALMNTLEQQQWIDRYTRAVFVEFTTYNAQVRARVFCLTSCI